MKLIVKHFSQLSTDELFEIYRLRVSVFVVEQKCAYQEVDDIDKIAYHVYLADEAGIHAYARVFPNGKDVSIGRVIAVKRRCGLGSQIVQAAVRVAEEHFSADKITLEAQVYARKLYENLGFRQVSGEFLEDGIAHVRMERNLEVG